MTDKSVNCTPCHVTFQVQILSHGRIEVYKPRTLSLGPTASVLSHNSKAMIDRTADSMSDTLWMNKVT